MASPHTLKLLVSLLLAQVVVGRSSSTAEHPRVALQDYSTTKFTPSANGLPDKTQANQTGTNRCGDGKGDDMSLCQNLYIASPIDWCLYGPPSPGNVSDYEADAVAFCTQGGRGTRLIKPGTIHGASFVYAPGYVQITGTGDFTKMNVLAGDDGGELDAHGATNVGNPAGDVVFVKKPDGTWARVFEWAEFLADRDFCIRACYDGPQATSLCRHTYDTLGCGFNMPAHYPESGFEVCHTDNAADIAYYNGKEYKQDDGPPPEPHDPPTYYNCTPFNEAELYGEIVSGAFDNGNATYKAYSGPINHGTTGGTTNSSAAGNTNSNMGGNAGSGGMGQSSPTANKTTGGSAMKPTSTNASVSVQVSQQIGAVFILVVTALLAGCIFL